MAPDRCSERRQALLAGLGDTSPDGLLVSSLPNIRYLTGFTGSAAMAAVLQTETVLLTDSRYRTQANAEVSGTVRVEIVDTQPWVKLGEVLRESRTVESLGFEANTVTVDGATRLAASCAPVTWLPTTGVVESLRERKDPGEVEAIRQAAGLAHEALEASTPSIRVGAREVDVAACLERELRIRGSEWHPFHTIVASGPRTALPHAGTTDREIRAGEFVLLDFGAQVDGYCADITRTLVIGRRADERQRTTYNLVERAQLQARDGLRAGLTGKEGDALARRVIEEEGLGDAFVHSLGHGLGLEVHEAPRLSRTNDAPLSDGAVVTVEPGVYIEGWGGVRIEDDVVLHTERAELVSDGRTELREII